MFGVHRFHEVRFICFIPFIMSESELLAEENEQAESSSRKRSRIDEDSNIDLNAVSNEDLLSLLKTYEQ